MAGGTFNLSSPKVRPGAYANTKNGKQPTTATVPSGIAIIPLIGYDWGPRGEMIHLTPRRQNSDVLFTTTTDLC